MLGMGSTYAAAGGGEVEGSLAGKRARPAAFLAKEGPRGALCVSAFRSGSCCACLYMRVHMYVCVRACACVRVRVCVLYVRVCASAYVRATSPPKKALLSGRSSLMGKAQNDDVDLERREGAG
eukprot:565373-Pelagomonas_calceolata.AAC.3